MRRNKTWRLRVDYDDIAENKISSIDKDLHVYLSLRTIPQKVRRTLNTKNIMWIDIERKEQSLFWNDLGEEVTLYLKRYGVRLTRVEE